MVKDKASAEVGAGCTGFYISIPLLRGKSLKASLVKIWTTAFAGIS
jgi:hypothetical protein